MRRIFFLLLLGSIFLASCDEYCPYCEEYDCRCEQNCIRYNSDYFCAETLLGTWQCDYYNYVGNMLLKEIKFLNNRKCDITYSVGNSTDWYTETYNYSYVGKTIRFSKGNSIFEFHIDGYIFPELYLRDSFNRYTWRKVRSYGC